MSRKKFKFYKQIDHRDCGVACLQMILRYHGKSVSHSKIRTLAEVNRQGASLDNISAAAEKMHLRTLGVKIDYQNFADKVPLPAIVHWENNHFVVVQKIKKNTVYVADPAHDIIKYSKEEFIQKWVGENADDSTREGIALVLEPTTSFFGDEDGSGEGIENKNFTWSIIYASLIRYKRFFYQLFFGLVAGSLMQLIFPFLTQSIVDIGIRNQDIGFVYLILGAQLFLFLGGISVELIRSWILLHLSTRINITLISDFFIKLMNLPINYFDSRLTGDIIQRINDHSRIEQLLTTSSLNTLFSLLNLAIFGAVLAYYHSTIFLIFFIGTILYFSWIMLFLKKRKELDYRRFSFLGAEQSKVIEMVGGMQEIKLHNAERQKRWSWEYLQARLFKLEVKNLRLEQTQSVGSSFLNELKNILITFFAATLVIQGELTLGMMLSISYIMGQLNGPIQQLVVFTHSVQDAKIAMERISEIHEKEDEEPDKNRAAVVVEPNQDLVLKNVHFRYQGSPNMVLKGVDFTIPAKRITAVVGGSGSGKTTLMKLLLKFYDPIEGEVNMGTTNMTLISQRAWRDKFGVVMQEGFIFNDTIAGNIAVGQEDIDLDRLLQAVEVANIKDFVESLPLSYNTQIGSEGMGLSTGQKQRLRIARAVYKNPEYLFFDEATSALDAHNERVIMNNLQDFYKDKTVFIIAHRLSTVKNADQIVVLNNGKIEEIGKHSELLLNKGPYYNLVKNQLELERLGNSNPDDV